MFYIRAALEVLFPSVGEHGETVAEVHRFLRDTVGDRCVADASFHAPGDTVGSPGTLDYLRKHFFSVTFLALYRSVGVPQDRRLFYGAVNHSIRGIVTASDKHTRR